MSENYNYVFIHLTNVRKDFFSFSGNPSIKTPGFDYLGTEGIFFSNVINPAIYSQSQMKSSVHFFNELVSKKTALLFWASLMAKGYGFFESHFSSHPIDPRITKRQVIYPRILMDDADAKRLSIERTKEIHRFETFINKSNKPFVAHFTTDELKSPFQVEQSYYDMVQTLKIPRRSNHNKTNQQSSTIFGASIWEENHWHEMRQTYLGQLLKVDEGIVFLVNLLRQSNLLDNTVIIAYGQGTPSLGDYGFEIVPNDERCLSYTNVPLFVKFPTTVNRTEIDSNILTNLADLWPTLHALAGVDCPKGEATRKLLSLLSKDRSNRPQVTGSHYRKSLFGTQRLSDYVVGKTHYLMLKQGHAALFSNNDPYGLKNLVQQEEYASIIEQLKLR